MSIENDEPDITGNESLEEIEAMLEAWEAKDVDSDLGDAPHADEHASRDLSNDDGKEGDTDAASPPAAPDLSPEGILAKDQKHIIPMAVLERERQEKAQLRQEVEQLKAKAAQLDKAERLIALRNHQLEDYGVAPADLPEDLKVSDDKLAELREEYPQLGDAIVALNNKIDALAANRVEVDPSPPPAPAPPQAPATDTELTAALQGNADLQSWLSQGDPRWSAAQQIDSHLSSRPEWANKSYAERFDEVSKRVRLAFGDEPKPSAQDALQAAQTVSRNAQQALPDSPSELGNTHRAGDSDLMSRVEKANGQELNALFDKLTPAQIEQLMTQAGF